MSIVISPHTELVSVKRSIKINGLAQGNARMLTSMEKADGSYWCSHAIFKVGASGILDLEYDAPISGDWTIAHSMAPVWSMRKVRGVSNVQKVADIDPITVKITVTDAGGTVQRGSFIQYFMAPGIRMEEIVEPGISGAVFFPSGPGPHPVIIAVNGSGGGMPKQRCAQYAANGYIAIALAYFGAPGRPRYFEETPLEYFEQAILWAKKTFRPKDDFVAISGISRGGELALLLASTFNEHIKATVAYVPSAVVNGIQQAGVPGEPRDNPAWSLNGASLANLWRGNPDADVNAYTTPEEPGVPIRQDRAFLAALSNQEFVEQSRIQVEKIKGPILMVSGEDDGCWPSAHFCRMVEDSLEAAGHPWPVTHIFHPAAGHSLCFPYIPTSEIVISHPVSGVVMDFGGTAAINAESTEKSWPQVMDFLRNAPELYKKYANK